MKGLSPASLLVEKKLAEGMTPDRVQSMGNNVFGFAMTLLALNLLVPENLPSEQLKDVFWGVWPQFLTFFMSFMVLGVFWIGGQSFFRWMRYLDRTCLWLYITFLSLVVLVPFTTAILRTYYYEEIALVAYGINMVACGATLYWFWLHASKKRELLTEETTPEIIWVMKGRVLVPVITGVGITLFAFVSPIASLFMFAGLFILATAPTNSDRVAAAVGNLFKKN